MRAYASLAAACGVLLLAGGCGGGGGGGGENAVHPLTDTLRSYQVGDQWVYNVSGTWKGVYGAGVPMGGTVTASIGTMTMGDNPYTGITVFRDLRPQSAVYQERRTTLIRQEAPTRSVVALGDKRDTGFWRMVINDPPPVTIPGTFRLTVAVGWTTQYENGEHSHHTHHQRATAAVTTPVGAFMTYEVLTTADDPKYGTSTRTEWWHPGLGAPVKYQEHAVIPGGATLDYTATLTSTTVPHP